jgi:hypothetical protein
LSRSAESWDGFEIPEQLRSQADSVWELVCRLPNEREADADTLLAALDTARASYIQLYEEAEAIAQSSAWAAKGAGTGSPAASRLLVRAVPKKVRRRLPVRVRRAAARLLS